MIGRLTGVLIEKKPPLVLLDVQGVGYEVNVPMSTFYTLPGNDEKVTLHTYLVVREDAHLLYGFVTETERQAFRQLVKISGVGARTALAVLSGLSVTDLYQAVVDQDSKQIIKIPGIGKKTAERLLLELRDKLNSDMISVNNQISSSKVNNDVLNALLSLGYNEREASWVTKQLSVDVTVSEGIRQALKLLSKEK
ncbi:MAG: Holliday junction branch migration protein RuvA [Nitrosomonadaceae bacterium]|nr:Holliday junction branch migration protein RuvA [Nitrosomonadaceae bacterium]|tara:strand:- start:118 stop:702 length:585 start_codon:yes stop_codon:yes gene_type:complete